MIMEFDIFGNKLLVHVPQIFLTQKETLFKTLKLIVNIMYLV